jgi:hypothetical protein
MDAQLWFNVLEGSGLQSTKWINGVRGKRLSECALETVELQFTGQNIRIANLRQHENNI